MLKRVILPLIIFINTVVTTSLISGSISYWIQKIQTSNYTKQQMHLYPPLGWTASIMVVFMLSIFALLIYYATKKALSTKYKLSLLIRIIAGCLAVLTSFIVVTTLTGYIGRIASLDAKEWLRLLAFSALHGPLIVLLDILFYKIFNHIFKITPAEQPVKKKSNDDYY